MFSQVGEKIWIATVLKVCVSKLYDQQVGPPGSLLAHTVSLKVSKPHSGVCHLSQDMRIPVFAICEQQRHRSAISAFVFRCLDSIITLVSISQISILYLGPVSSNRFRRMNFAKLMYKVMEIRTIYDENTSYDLWWNWPQLASVAEHAGLWLTRSQPFRGSFSVKRRSWTIKIINWQKFCGINLLKSLWNSYGQIGPCIHKLY